MGYTTEFSGRFLLDKPLTEDHAKYLKAFSERRHMKRDVNKLGSEPDPLRIKVNLNAGEEGEFFLGGKENDSYMDFCIKSILDYNEPPSTQPGLWCKWAPSDDSLGIEWDSGEKFYNYTAWLEYLINNFLKPWGYTLNGTVYWRGEDYDDQGYLIVEDNKVSTQEIEMLNVTY